MNAIWKNVRITTKKTGTWTIETGTRTLAAVTRTLETGKKVTSGRSTLWAQKVTIRDLLWDLKSYYNNHSSFIRIGGKVQEEITLVFI